MQLYFVAQASIFEVCLDSVRTSQKSKLAILHSPHSAGNPNPYLYSMRLLLSTVQYPELNLALEEALLREEDDYILIYRNVDSVICGKHQVLMAEINAEHCYDEQIPLYRRLSGGGTVYHDPGNLNFSFIQTKISGSQVDFRAASEPVIAFLQSIGLPAHFGGHNDIRVGDFKVSGNAEHIYKNRVLHHGTLLYNADLEQLSMSLRIGDAAYSGYRVRSVPAMVSNISTLETSPLGMEAFISKLQSFLTKWFKADVVSAAPDRVYELSEELALTKYATEDWIYGHSPDYIFEKEKGPHRLHLKVSKGYITEAHFHSSRTDVRCLDLESALNGKRHAPGLADELSTQANCLTKEELRSLLS
jgi:lipoate---protein ligase